MRRCANTVSFFLPVKFILARPLFLLLPLSFSVESDTILQYYDICG